MLIPSVVVDNLNIFRAMSCPDKAHAELIIDADAVLTFSISAQGLQSVARWRTKIRESTSSIELI